MLKFKFCFIFALTGLTVTITGGQYYENPSTSCDAFPQFRISNISCDPVEFCYLKVHKMAQFNTELKKCVIPLQYPCGRKIDARSTCARNSFCTVKKICECENQFVKDAYENCVRGMGFGAICDNENDRYPQICPVDEGFECRNGKCVCEYGRFWSKETDSCVKFDCETRAESGIFFNEDTAKCTLELGNDLGYYFLRFLRDNLITCPKNAHIEEGYSEIRIGPPVGVCMCDEGFHVTKDGKGCWKNGGYGESCDYKNGDFCDPWAGLSCQRGVCECQYATWNKKQKLCNSKQDCRNRDVDSYFDPAANSCFKRVGSSCDAYTGVKCPQNSICQTANKGSSNATRMFCKCEDHFAEGKFREGCLRVRQFDENCDGFYMGNICSPQSKLTCLNTGEAGALPKCSCESNQIWNPKDRVCNLKEGQTCVRILNSTNTNVEFQCTMNSICEGPPGRNSYCVCKSGFVKSRKWECLPISSVQPTYSKCELTSDCS